MFNNEICNLVYIHDLHEITNEKIKTKTETERETEKQNTTFSIRKLISDSFKTIGQKIR